MKNSRESGQVLITGIVMMAILLLVILYAFDVHNVIRAKLKVDIAQQAAAMAGANWQKESLNLIGEINLLKASALLLEGSDNWNSQLPDREKEPDVWRREMQARVGLLTEMQTRVSFIGPLIGFAAAQQAAKSNGLDGINGAFNTYLELLRVDKRYDPAQGGAPKYINNYDWKEPYYSLVSRINNNRVAIFPNARTAGMPYTRPRELANERFYTEIMRSVTSVSAADPPKKHHWNLLISTLKTMDDVDFQGKWWEIDYSNNRFPNESEIFTLGVEFGGEYRNTTVTGGYRGNNTLQALNDLRNDLQFYESQGSLPAEMKWCIYDQWWMPEYYGNKYPEYGVEHYGYWFKGGALRKEVKEQYIYEGPAAYVEGFADVTAKVNVRPSVRPYDSNDFTQRIWKRNAREAVKSKDNSILLRKRQTTSRIGTRRGQADDSDVSTTYRPGSIAKALGELKNNKPPIEVDMILPVFKNVSVMPTFMPIPYGFQVLKPGYSNLEKFLNWLAEQKNLNGTPPEGTEHYLEALQFLVNGVRDRARGKEGKVDPKLNSHISGRALRYYGYNHKFNKGAFENEFKPQLWKWYEAREKRVFQQKILDGPGYLQEPRLFDNAPYISAEPMNYKQEITDVKKRKFENSQIVNEVREERWEINRALNYQKLLAEGEQLKYKNSQIVIKKIPVKYEVYEPFFLQKDDNIYFIDNETHKVFMPDTINGGTACRVYVEVAPKRKLYYVIDSRNRIVLNGEPDPTIQYNRRYTTGGGDMHIWNPGRYDGSRGPVRL